MKNDLAGTSAIMNNPLLGDNTPSSLGDNTPSSLNDDTSSLDDLTPLLSDSLPLRDGSISLLNDEDDLISTDGTRSEIALLEHNQRDLVDVNASSDNDLPVNSPNHTAQRQQQHQKASLHREFHITKFSPTITPAQIKEFVMNKTLCNINEISVFRLTKKNQNLSKLAYVNFKIETVDSVAGLICEKDFWPSHCTITPFIRKGVCNLDSLAIIDSQTSTSVQYRTRADNTPNARDNSASFLVRHQTSLTQNQTIQEQTN